MGWQWLKQGLTVQAKLQANPSASDAAFYQGKLAAMRYFFAYELPKTLGLESVLMAGNSLTVELDSKVLG
jgi:butyryl-CoA dehydrogenase